MSEYIITFGKGTPIWNLYQKLNQDGVKDADLDTGYPETDYVNKTRTIIHRNDHQIQPEEVLDYALERYERYQLTIKETTAYVVPWTLDDLDPTTTFDAKIREKVDQAISEFKKILASKGLKEGTDRYNELLGISLYALAMTPPQKGVFSPLPLLSFIFKTDIPEYIKFELKKEELSEVRRFLEKYGGLALIQMKGDCELEATALEALEKSCGSCTEKSAILYALFKMADLKVNFVNGMPSYESYKKFKWETGSVHGSLGLFLKRGIRFFDPAVYSSPAEIFYKTHFAWWFEQTPREFLARYYSNLGNEYGQMAKVLTEEEKIKEAKDKVELAITELKKALEINPNSAEAHNNLGVAYYKKGELDLAILEYKKALEINPNSAEAHNNLGNAYFDKDELDLAIAEYKKAIDINPNFAEAHYSLGVAYGGKGELDLAIAAFKKALEINPNYAEAHYNLGVAYREKGELDLAIAAFKKALEINPNYAKAHYNLGLIYSKRDELELAITEYERAIKINSGHDMALFNLGSIYKEMAEKLEEKNEIIQALKMYRKALTIFQKAAKLKVDNFGKFLALGGLGSVQEKIKQLEGENR